MPLSVYLVAPPGPRNQLLSSDELAETVHRIESVAPLGALDERNPGLVLVDRDTIEGSDILSLAHRVGEAGAGWTFAVI
jgi:hypothetical protein